MNNINIGINGFGRIGKCAFLQLINNQTVNINAININNLSIDEFENYINNDSIHHTQQFKVTILKDNYIQINNKKIKIFNDKDPKNLNWKKENVQYLFETSGAFRTTEKAKQHDVDYIIMSAPPKDIGITPIYCYGVNENNYKNEHIISAASCTTNCIAPMLKFLYKFNIEHGHFITVHSATASQSVVDTANFQKRTNRTIFNNIIPHTTGASESLDVILPELLNKIVGTSVRVPVTNVSMIDLNIEFKNKISKDFIISRLEEVKNEVITTNNNKLVSSDFIGNKTPTILDTNSTLQLTDKCIKFTLWYDNEWSYTAQMIRLLKFIHNKNNNNSINKIENVNCHNKNVFVRVDFNCPTNDKNEITDYFRINSCLKTIKKIMYDNPKQIFLATHFGRPKNVDKKFSTERFVEYLEEKLNNKVIFLVNGLNTSTEELQLYDFYFHNQVRIYLMENVRFHKYEKDLSLDFKFDIPVDIYCNEAFACSHREHKSIVGIPNKVRTYGYCFINEINALNLITNNHNSKILAIIGGSKIHDKIPMLRKLSEKVSYIYITGNNINFVNEYKEFFDEIKNNKAKIIYTKDGFNSSGYDKVTYVDNINYANKIFDIGPNSINDLYKYVKMSDIVFWNGTLGIVEHEFFKNGSENLVNMLNSCKAKVIIGGGDTSGFVNKYENNFYHISTGGGASIDYIGNGTLPGYF